MSQEARYKLGEVCRLADVQPYVLRYWESEFPVLAPDRNVPGPRSYSTRDLRVVERIKKLLYDEGFTIAGAKKRLEAEMREWGPDVPASVPAEPATTAMQIRGREVREPSEPPQMRGPDRAESPSAALPPPPVPAAAEPAPAPKRRRVVQRDPGDLAQPALLDESMVAEAPAAPAAPKMGELSLESTNAGVMPPPLPPQVDEPSDEELFAAARGLGAPPEIQTSPIPPLPKKAKKSSSPEVVDPAPVPLVQPPNPRMAKAVSELREILEVLSRDL